MGELEILNIKLTNRLYPCGENSVVLRVRITSPSDCVSQLRPPCLELPFHVSRLFSTGIALDWLCYLQILFLSVDLIGLIRFIPKNDPTVTLIGEPTSKSVDVGLSLRQNQPISAYIFDGSSVLSPGQRTNQEVEVGRVLSPVAQNEVGTIRCIGLNASYILSLSLFRDRYL